MEAGGAVAGESGFMQGEASSAHIHGTSRKHKRRPRSWNLGLHWTLEEKGLEHSHCEDLTLTLKDQAGIREL